jgi:autotransporter-associated beta strand protein
MKTILLATFVSLCLLAGNVNAAEFPNASVTDGIIVCDSVALTLDNAMKLRAAGVSGVRAAFYWNILEDANGPTWDLYDTFVTNCAKAGLRVYANFENTNPVYYQNPYDPNTQTDLYNAHAAVYVGSSDFRNDCDRFIQTTVSHYTTLANTLSQQYTDWNPQFTWELWNEPNLGFWPGQSADAFMNFAMGVPGETYSQGALQTIRDTAAAVGGVAGSPTIVAPGVAMPHVDGYPDAIPYLTTCIQKGLLTKVDGISIHPYMFWNAPEDAVAYYDAVRNLSPQIRSSTNPNGIPIIDAEWGYISEAIGLQTQADYLQRTMLVNFSQSVPVSLWYMSVDMSYNDWTFGLFEEIGGYGGPWGPPKPSYYAMKTLTSNLAGKTYSTKVSSNSADYILAFQNAAGRKTYAAWTTGSPVTRSSITLAGGSIRAYLTGTPMYLGEVQTLQGTSTADWSTATWGNSMGGVNGGWVAGSQAKIGTSNRIVNVDTNVDFSGIQFSASGITINSTGGSLVLGSGGGIISNAGTISPYNVTINANIIGGGESAAACQVVKTGAGRLTLGGDNSFGGNFIISQGTVLLNNARALAGPVVTLRSTTNNRLQFASGISDFYLGGLAGDQSLNIDTHNLYIGESNLSNDADGVGYSGALSGSGAIEKRGTGNFLVSGANTGYTGQVTVKDGFLAMGNASMFSASNIILAGGGLDLRGLNFSRGLTVSGDGSTIANTVVDTTSTWTLPSGGVQLNYDITARAEGALNIQGTLASATSTFHTVTKTGAGVLSLNGDTDNAYLNLAVNAGTAQLNKTSTADVHAAANVTVASGATAQYTGVGDYQVWGGGAITLAGGTLDFNGHNQSDASLLVQVANSVLTNSSSNAVVYSPNSVTLSTDLTVSAVGTLDVNGPITANNHVLWRNAGDGMLRLSGTTSNTSLTAVNYTGTLQLAKNAGAIAADVAYAMSGATVQYATADNQLPAFGTLLSEGGVIDFNGRSQSGTELRLSDQTDGSTLANLAVGTTSTYAPNSVTTITRNFTVNTAGDLHLTAGLACNNANWPGLSKIGSGQLYLDGAADNTFLTVHANEGTTVLAKENTSASRHAAVALSVAQGATVRYAGSGDYQLASNPGYWIHLAGGTLDFNGRNQRGTDFTAFDAGSTLANNAAHTNSVYTPNNFNYQQNLTVNTVGDLEINGAIVGNNTDWPSLTKTGAGTLTLSGTTGNTYTTLIASEGTVKLNKTNTTWGRNAATAVAVNSGATVQYTGSGNYQVASGNWIQLYGGTLDLNGRTQADIDFSCQTAGSTLANTHSAAATLSPTSFTLNAALNVDTVGGMTINGPISGVGGLTKNGVGTLTLTRANTYSGGTTINNGSLRIAAEASLNDSVTGEITLNGGTLLVNSTAPLTRSITMYGGTVGGMGQYVGNLTPGNGHLSPGDGGIGTLSVTGNLSLSSSSVLDYDFGITAGSCDRLSMTGNLILDGTLNVTSSALAGGSYTIFSGATSITDNGLDFGVVPPSSRDWAYSIANNNGVYSVIVTAAPEPGTLVLLATALLGILAYAWRKRK